MIKKRKSTEILGRETRRILIVVSFLAYFILAGWFTPYLPKEIQTELAEDEFLFDFHVHTYMSDGSISPRQRVDWYINQGIHGAAFADHHSIHGSLLAERYVERYNLDFTVLIAQEYTISVPRVHLNIFGIRENINPIEYLDGVPLESRFYDSLFLNVSDMIAYVKDNGGWVTVNHYPRENPYTWQQFVDWGVDGFEIINGGSEQNPELTQFCRDNNMIMIAGSDIHEGQDLDTFIKLRLDDPSNKSVDAIFEALKRNDHEAIEMKKQYGDPSPLASLNQKMDRYFSGLDLDQRYSWIAWMFISYAIGAVIYFITRSKVNQN